MKVYIMIRGGKNYSPTSGRGELGISVNFKLVAIKVRLNQRWARSRSLILIFKITTGDLDLLGDLDHFQIDLDLLN